MRTRKDIEDRAQRVLQLIAKGMTHRAVAERIGVTHGCVDAIVSKAKREAEAAQQ